MTAFDEFSRHSTTSVYASLALGEPVDVPGVLVTVPDYYVVRDLDNVPGVFSAYDVFANIHST